MHAILGEQWKRKVCGFAVQQSSSTTCGGPTTRAYAWSRYCDGLRKVIHQWQRASLEVFRANQMQKPEEGILTLAMNGKQAKFAELATSSAQGAIIPVRQTSVARKKFLRQRLDSL